MADRLQLINTALAEIGEEPISQLVESGTPFSETDHVDDVTSKVSLIYPMVKSEILNDYPWSWLLYRTYLQKAMPGAPPARARMYRWFIPNSISTIRAVYDASNIGEGAEFAEDLVHSEVSSEDWKIRGNYLFTTFDNVIVLAQHNDTAESDFPKLIENAMVLKLAARFAIAIPFDMNLSRHFLSLAEQALGNARRVDSQRNPPERLERFEFIDARVAGVFDVYHRGCY